MTKRAAIELQDSKKDWTRMSRHLRKLTNDELLSLLSATRQKDWQPMDELLQKFLPMFREKVELRNDLESQVRELAEFNYAREPEFARDRVKMRKLLDDLKTIKERLAESRMSKILDKAHEKLSTTAGEFEDNSEIMAKRFLESQINHNEFLETYISLRKEAHLKRILADRMARDKSYWSSP